MLKYLAERLREPSTYAGLSVLLGLFGVHLAPEWVQPIITTGSGLGALIAVMAEG